MSHTPQRTSRWIGSLLAAGLLLALTGCDGVALPTSVPTAAPTLRLSPSQASPSISTTVDPTSIAPTSAAPTSTAPTTAPPTSVPPTSAPPTSAPPTSAPPTSAPPTSTPPTASASPTPAPAPGNSGLPWWVWLILAAAVIGGAVYVILRSSRDRAWDRRFETVGGELSWIHDQVVPQLLASPTTGAAAQLWQTSQSRVATVESELRGLGSASVSEKRTTRANHLRRLLASVSIAIEAYVSLPQEATVDQIRDAAMTVRNAQADLQEGLANGGTPPAPPRMAR